MLDAQKTQEERNSQGQFATPAALAKDILSYSVGLLPQKQQIRFLDPGIGTGSFYSALRETASEKNIVAAEGFEIDTHYGVPAQKLWDETSLKIHMEDFIKAQLPTEDEKRFNLLICNPPYVRHHHIYNGEKARLQDASGSACGVRITGLAGLYCYFLALSHAWMNKGGVVGWLIPSEFMNVNYGRYLCRNRKLWYSQEDRKPSPFICTYLGRSDKKSGKAFRFILNASNATAANVYLMLYPKTVLEEALARDPELGKKIWILLNDISDEDLLGEGRVYGGGLHKLEPKELANVPADEIMSRIGAFTILGASLLCNGIAEFTKAERK